MDGHRSSAGSANADRDATDARCRVSSASGISAEARIRAAPMNAGRTFTISPISRDSRTRGRNPWPPDCGESRECGRQAVHVFDAVRQDRRVLESLAAALA